MWFFYFKKLYFDLFLNLTPDQRIFKNNPQHEAFKTLSGIEGLAIIQGYGGSGKSYVLEAIKKAYEVKRHYRKRVAPIMPQRTYLKIGVLMQKMSLGFFTQSNMATEILNRKKSGSLMKQASWEINP
jgi:AAA15 family ATPase/GTPase